MFDCETIVVRDNATYAKPFNESSIAGARFSSLANAKLLQDIGENNVQEVIVLRSVPMEDDGIRRPDCDSVSITLVSRGYRALWVNGKQIVCGPNNVIDFVFFIIIIIEKCLNFIFSF